MSSRGIDIRQAMAILAERTPHYHHQSEEKHADGCSCQNAPDMPPNAASMGQTIDMVQTNQGKKELEEQKRKLEEEKIKRKQQLEARMSSMSPKELLQVVLASQQERVQVYKEYDRGLETALASGNIAAYPALVANATAQFAVLSDTIRQAKTPAFSKLIDQLQQHERMQLETTAALHLEKIRHANEQDERVRSMLREGIDSLQNKIQECRQAITEVVQELQCELADME